MRCLDRIDALNNVPLFCAEWPVYGEVTRLQWSESDAAMAEIIAALLIVATPI
jgi:hypothetical protein